MMTALALAGAAPASASAIDIVTGSTVAQRHPDFATVPAPSLTPQVRLPQLPVPDVVAMMLVGLVLIGYRASRDSDEKFT